ncbi:unnamed protein product, partial [marine sediment metagenome]
LLTKKRENSDSKYRAQHAKKFRLEKKGGVRKCNINLRWDIVV